MKIKSLAMILCFFACSSDVSIMKRVDDNPSDDSAVVTDSTDTEQQSEPSGEPSDTQTSEPSDEMTELTVGYGEIHFRQIACPPCVGAASEFDITATLKF